VAVSVAKASVSEPRRRLVELMQSINFGRVEGLAIRNQDPVLCPPPRVVREYKFGGENGPRPELGIGNFLLKQQVVDLFAFFDDFEDGTIDVLEVKHGLPFRVIVVEVLA
jgi:hypothetical protein